MEELFEAEKLEPRYDPEHYKRLGFSDEEAREQVRRAQNPRELKTVQRNRGNGPDPKQEANFHSPEERAQLDQARRQPKRRPQLPRAKAMLMALPTVGGPASQS